MLKVKLPDDDPILKSAESSPLIIEYDIVSPSSSVAITMPTFVWFSSTVNILLEVNTGASLTFTTLIVTIWFVDNTPSLAWIVNKYDCLVS